MKKNEEHLVILRLKNINHYSKYPLDINNVDIDKIITSNMVSFGKEGFIYFIGYKNKDKVKPMCVMHPKMSGYSESFDGTRSVFFFSFKMSNC